MSDTVTITSDIVDGQSITTGGTGGITVNTSVVESTSVTSNVVTGAVGPIGPTGATGPANELTIGTVTGGVTADATITGTPPTQVLNLTLPKGDQGEPGADSTVPGPQGPKGDQGDPTTVNGKTGASITLTPDDLDDTSTSHKFVTATDLTNLGNLSGTNTGDQDLSGLQPKDATLTALAAYATNGILTQTAADTFTGRTITGTTNQITLTNGDGVAGNPTVSIPSALSIPGTLATTGGTATHSLTLPSTSTGIALYNTADQTTNYERARMYWSSNILYFTTEKGGSGTDRIISFSAGGSTIQMNTLAAPTSGLLNIGGTVSVANSIIYRAGGTYTASSGVQYGVSIASTINQSSTAGYTALLINPTETTTGSGAKNLIDAQVGGVSKFKVDNTGKLTTGIISNANLDTTAGEIGGAWTDWTPTITGFSSNPTGGVYRYKVIGKTVHLMIRQANTGTSNASGFSITLPFTAATITNAEWTGACSVTDNGTIPTSPGLLRISSAGTVINVYKDFALNVFTTSGAKRVAWGMITYEVA